MPKNTAVSCGVFATRGNNIKGGRFHKWKISSSAEKVLALIPCGCSRLFSLILVLIAEVILMNASFHLVHSPQRTRWASLSSKVTETTTVQSDGNRYNQFPIQDSRKQMGAQSKALTHGMRKINKNRHVEWTDGNEGLGNVGVILLAILAELLIIGLAGTLAYSLGSVGLAIALGIVATAAIVFFTVKWIKRRNKKKMEKAKSEAQVEKAE